MAWDVKRVVKCATPGCENMIPIRIETGKPRYCRTCMTSFTRRSDRRWKKKKNSWMTWQELRRCVYMVVWSPVALDEMKRFTFTQLKNALRSDELAIGTIVMDDLGRSYEVVDYPGRNCLTLEISQMIAGSR